MDLPQNQIELALLGLAALLLAVAVALAPRGSGPSRSSRRTGARRFAVGILVGGAVGACAAGGGAVLGDPPSGSTWPFQGRPDVVADAIAVVCGLALLLFARGDPEHRAGWVLGALAAAAVAGFSGWRLVGEVTSASLATPPQLGLMAAVATSLLLSEGRRARKVARARTRAIDASGDGTLVVDAEGRIFDVRGAAAEALMESAEPGARGKLPRLPAVVREQLSRERDQPLRVKAGAVRHLEIWSNGGAAGPRNGLRGLLVRDTTRQRRDARNLIRLAHYDSLTGLANRRLFLRTLKRQIEAARVSGAICALLYIDLDHFKDVNDTLGHGVGDELLQELTRRLVDRLRPEHFQGSTLPRGASIHLARLSGDEFAAIVSKVTDAEAAREVAEHIHRLMAEPIQIEDRALISSVSIGIALFPKDGGDIEELIRSADTAVYTAKNSGRGRSAFYEASVNAEKERESRMAQALGQAIARSELRLHYQPKVSVTSGTTVGFEALLRWQSAELGNVSPSDFIPVAEERGLIQEIGAWCLDDACRRIRRWLDDGFVPVPVSVNVSSMQFREQDLQRNVTEALKAYRVDPGLLEIELTESLLLAEGDSTSVCLRDLRAIGVGIALDDFGTGYSALAYLNRFPLDVLKLDRAFLREIHLDRSAARLASAVISMAHGLGLKVVAEGVDCEEQVPVLREMHCDQIQGFLYSPAVPPEEAVHLLARPGESAPVVPFAAESPGRRPSRTPVEVEVEAEIEATPAPETDARQPLRGLLLVDDGAASLEPVVVRLLHLGVKGLDLQYAAQADEARLLLAEESQTADALVVPPTLDPRVVVSIRQQLERKRQGEPPLVVIGEEPNPSVRSRLRSFRETSVLWSPFEDVELAFVLKSALTARCDLSRRVDIRVPVNLTARLQAGRMRETVVLSSLSPRGAFLELSDPPPVGSELRLEFDLPSDSFRMFARVLYHAHEDPDCPFSQSGIGVAFFGADRKVELGLTKAVEERAERYLP